MQIACNITISGVVQGVSFRYYTRETAHDLGIVGFIQNLPGGNVYIECQGEEENLKQFIAWCKTGPDRARIDSIDIVSMEPKNFLDFQIK